MSLFLKIVSPSKEVYSGDVDSVVVPGTNGKFEILTSHAPIISSLEAGSVIYQDSKGKHELSINTGFVEVQKNRVTLCVEI